MRRLPALLAMTALAAAPLAAQSTNYYLLDGDNGAGFIVRNGAVQSTFSTTNPTPNFTAQYALRFQGDNFLVARRQGQQAIEYNAAGTATGTVYNYPNQNFDELLDGTTDGTFTYSARCCSGGGIVRGDINFGGMAQLGNITTGLSGVTYVASRNSLFATNFGTSLLEYSLTGTLLNSYSLNVGGFGALAYEASTNSLWGAVNGTNQIRNYSLTGTLLGTVSVSGGLVGNVWGGEMRNPATVVPEPSTYALMATGLAALAAVARRRRRA